MKILAKSTEVIRKSIATAAGVGTGMATYTAVHKAGASDLIAVPVSAGTGIAGYKITDIAAIELENKLIAASNRRKQADLGKGGDNNV